MSTPRPIQDVADELGLAAEQYDVHGRHRAKIHVDDLVEPGQRPGRYVLVTATTPTSAGVGKTVTAIGLAMGLSRLGHRSAVSLRESALGPTLGAKGGGAGGGCAQVLPLHECLLELGDTVAVGAATNLLAAVIDDTLHRGGGIDASAITWRRVLDVDDRSLRQVVVGLGGRLNGPPRETGFDITAASEVMAVLALSRDRADLRLRLGALVPAWDSKGKPVTAGQLGAAGAMAVLLRTALQPNLLQTSEGTPVLVHAGPFGNLSLGSSSVLADRFALPRVDFLVTEAGFGADLGAEKFFHLKCPASGHYPDVAVLTTTVRSLREHGGAAADSPDLAAVTTGTANLRHHIGILRAFEVPVVVTINLFPGDSSAEVALVRGAALKAGATAVTEHMAFAQGGSGCLELAEAVTAASRTRTLAASPHALYALTDDCRQKVHVLATQVYGATDVAWDPAAQQALSRFTEAGYGQLPVCMAKTHLSLSHDPTRRGVPTGFTLPVREVRLAAGAGYLTVLTGAVATMPGMPAHPRYQDLDLDADGTVVGLA